VCQQQQGLTSVVMQVASDTFALFLLSYENFLQVEAHAIPHFPFLRNISGDIVEGYRLTILRDQTCC
jgi:hypothetical protein